MVAINAQQGFKNAYEQGVDFSGAVKGDPDVIFRRRRILDEIGITPLTMGQSESELRNRLRQFNEDLVNELPDVDPLLIAYDHMTGGLPLDRVRRLQPNDPRGTYPLLETGIEEPMRGYLVEVLNYADSALIKASGEEATAARQKIDVAQRRLMAGDRGGTGSTALAMRPALDRLIAVKTLTEAFRLFKLDVDNRKPGQGAGGDRFDIPTGVPNTVDPSGKGKS